MICIDDYFNSLENKNLTIEEWKEKIKKTFDDLNKYLDSRCFS